MFVLQSQGVFVVPQVFAESLAKQASTLAPYLKENDGIFQPGVFPINVAIVTL